MMFDISLQKVRSKIAATALAAICLNGCAVSFYERDWRDCIVECQPYGGLSHVDKNGYGDRCCKCLDGDTIELDAIRNPYQDHEAPKYDY